MSVFLDWKEFVEEPEMIWIVLTATGAVDLPETRRKLRQLQSTLDHFRAHHSHKKFTFLFDFSQCKDFSKMAMLGDLKTFLSVNDALINSHLARSYILLRDPAWQFFLKLVFAFRPPKQPYFLKIPDDVYRVVRRRV